MIVRSDLWQLRRAFPQDASDLPPGRVVCVQHASSAVGSFHRQRELAVGARSNCTPQDISSRTKRGPSSTRTWTAVRIAQSIAGGNRVSRMQVRGIAGSDSRRDTALRVAGVAFSGSAFGEDEDVAMTGDFGSRAKRGNAAADDEKVRAKLQAAPDAAILPSQKTMRSKPPRMESRCDYRFERRAAATPLKSLRASPAACAPRWMLSTCRARRFIVSSQTVWRFHGDDLQSAVDEEPILIPDGERYKQLATVGRIYDALIRANADRSSAIVAIGGGVIGDVAGFAAATYLRGIPVVQVPTTLLAQVDSAVGGKVGVNHPMGKNLIGAFHPPAAVIVDPSLLATLPRREFRAGLYEVVKYGVIASRKSIRSHRRGTEAALRARTSRRCCRSSPSPVESKRTSSNRTSASPD